MKRFSIILLCLLLLLAAASSVGASVIGDSPTGKVIFTDADWGYVKLDGDGCEIDSYIGTAAAAVVPDRFADTEITRIGDHAFSQKDYITSVALNPYITSIGRFAFYNCTALETVTLNDKVASLDEGSFYGTSALSSLAFESTQIGSVPAYCFALSGLNRIELPETCTSIRPYAFLRCASLEKIVIPASVTEIADNAFVECERLVISAPYGSYAIQYAMDHEIPYEYSDRKKVTFIRGDADGDGEITIMDATKIQRVLVQLDDDSDGMIALRAKLGDESGLSIMDATRIQRKIALYDDPYSIGESVTKLLLGDGTIVDPESFSV